MYKLDPKRRLPHPSGPLSTTVSASSIVAANKEVKFKFSNREKLAITRYSAKNGVAASVYHSVCKLFCPSGLLNSN